MVLYITTTFNEEPVKELFSLECILQVCERDREPDRNRGNKNTNSEQLAANTVVIMIQHLGITPLPVHLTTPQA